MTLFKDKIYHRARSASLYALQYMKENEFLTLHNNVTVEQVKEFIAMGYFVACDYCDLVCDCSKMVFPAEQI